MLLQLFLQQLPSALELLQQEASISAELHRVAASIRDFLIMVSTLF